MKNVSCENCVYKIGKEYSKSQFNMAWAKIQEIANALRISKWDVYKECLRAYGQSVIYVVDEHGLDVLKNVFAIVDTIKVESGTYHAQAWYGIEYMNSKELAIFTDGILEEWNNVRG